MLGSLDATTTSIDLVHIKSQYVQKNLHLIRRTTSEQSADKIKLLAQKIKSHRPAEIKPHVSIQQKTV